MQDVDRNFLLTVDVVDADGIVAKTSSHNRWDVCRNCNCQSRLQILSEIEVDQPSTAVGEYSRFGLGGDCMGICDGAEKSCDGGDKYISSR